MQLNTWHLAFAARRLDLLSEELKRMDKSRPVHKGGHELGPAERDLIERCSHNFHFPRIACTSLACCCQTTLWIQPQSRWVCRADTFFIATGYEGPLPDGDGHAGLDISHRGGFPGFVRVDGPGTLKWPDYLGNLTFTTLGEPFLPWQAAQAFLAKQNGCITSIILMSSKSLGPSITGDGLKH